MKKITVIGFAIIFLAGLVPLLWFSPGYVISNGDSFPMYLNPKRL